MLTSRAPRPPFAARPARLALVFLALLSFGAVATAQIADEYPAVTGKTLKAAKKLEAAHKKAQSRIESDTEKLLSKLRKSLRNLKASDPEHAELEAVIATLEVGIELSDDVRVSRPDAQKAIDDVIDAIEEAEDGLDEARSAVFTEIADRLDQLSKKTKKKDKEVAEVKDLARLRADLKARFAVRARISEKALAKAAKDPLPTEHWQAVITSGLEWLKRHQDASGAWSSAGFGDACADGAKPCDGAGLAPHDVGVTGLALLALMRGADPEDREAQAAIDRGLTYLVKACSKEGELGKRRAHDFVYAQAMGTLALCEGSDRGGIEGLRDAIGRALDFIASARNPGAAWRYDAPPIGDNDTSITAWMVASLASARRHGFDVDDEHFDGALAWLTEVTSQGGRVGYDGYGTLSGRTQANDHYPREYGEAMTAAGLTMLDELAGALEQPETELMPEELVARMAGLIHACPPARRGDDLGVDLYYWMLGATALRGDRSPRADLWRRALGRALVDSQEPADCAEGSFAPTGTWGYSGGRVYATAASVLALAAALER